MEVPGTSVLYMPFSSLVSQTHLSFQLHPNISLLSHHNTTMLFAPLNWAYWFPLKARLRRIKKIRLRCLFSGTDYIFYTGQDRSIRHTRRISNVYQMYCSPLGNLSLSLTHSTNDSGLSVSSPLPFSPSRLRLIITTISGQATPWTEVAEATLQDLSIVHIHNVIPDSSSAAHIILTYNKFFHVRP